VRSDEVRSSSRIQPISALLTARRIRGHALILAVCLWGACIADYATPGPFDRAANIKFQDFLSFYISGKLIAQGRDSALYDETVRQAEMLRIAQPIDVVRETVFPPTAHSPTNVRIPNLYGPQVGLLFVPFAGIPFLVAGTLWVVLNLLIYFVSVYFILSHCPALRSHRWIVILCAVAYPPLFHFFVRGQISPLILLCFTATFLALNSDRRLLAGIFLGFLVLKPQFLVALPLILLVSRAWTLLAGLVASSAAQLAITRLYFGPAVMSDYLHMLWNAPRWIHTAELGMAHIQMHSLRSFWTLILPSPVVASILYALSSIAVTAIAAAIWRSASPLALRFSALILAAVLVNPHLFIYDLLALAPLLLLLAEWSIQNATDPSTPALRILLYLAFLLPLFGPLAQWTHLQLSVLTFAALLWTIHRIATRGQKLALHESAVV
jgi:hypothetical protein